MDLSSFNAEEIRKYQREQEKQYYTDEMENVVAWIKDRATYSCNNSASFDSMSRYVIEWLESKGFTVKLEENGNGFETIVVEW